ncbi:class F sortase [Streptomyces sp. MST-110588]|uniref:class F sortase n=1 Tax=Streptomyces sp. MST-110588 TaxID=2833628 RepID=UPI001F5CC3AB|nr:class F sortase [Streptomyces sp. MST-110588]UNO43348.1 class F sortase [Streptomyces sp. MST-110588]
MSRSRPPGRAVAAAVCALGAATTAAGWAMFVLPRPSEDAGFAPYLSRDAGSVPPAAAPVPAPSDGPGPAVPEEIHGPYGFRARLVPVAAAADGVLNLPADARDGAWWALGAPAGAARGTVLIAGHLDTPRTGPTAFAALHTFGMGTPVEVTGANGRTYRYVITARRTYARQALPRDLFTRGGSPRLALVTCAGAYKGAARGYDHNLVLYATRAPTTAPRPQESPAA